MEIWRFEDEWYAANLIDMQSNKQQPNLIVELSLEFALKIIRYTELLEEDRKYVIARQLLKSGTSIGASVREAQNAESKSDFIHKMKVAAKEADETAYWLTLCKRSDYQPCDDLLNDCTSLIKILSKIISSAKSSTG